MTTTNHATDLQAILDAAIATAKAAPIPANINAVDAARKSLDNYLAGTRFEKLESKTDPNVLSYLNSHGWKLKGSKLSADAKAGKLIQRNGFYYAKDIDVYAKNWCKPANSVITSSSDGLSYDIKRETVRKLRINNEEREGLLINRLEEEARDAKLWSAVKSDIENHAPAIVHELINRLLPIIEDDELRARVLALTHELRLVYEDAIADIFDRYAKIEGE